MPRRRKVSRDLQLRKACQWLRCVLAGTPGCSPEALPGEARRAAKMAARRMMGFLGQSQVRTSQR
jgi:hypothetical protein